MGFHSHKLKDAFPIVSISFDEVSDRPTTTEHHGGVDLEDEVLKESYYKDGPSSEHTEEWIKRNIKKPEPYTKEQQDWMKQIPERY